MNIHSYSLVIIGESELSECIISSIATRLKEMNIDKSQFKIINVSSWDNYNNGDLAFAIYFHKENKFTSSFLEKVIETKSIPILPVVKDSSSVNRLPFGLNKINALIVDSKDTKEIINSIVESILSGFFLLRKDRNIFISYKRSESQTIAFQLFHYFTACKYNVFLDAVSIDYGDDFQAELMHRIADTDVVIMLNTRLYHESKWCCDEFDAANRLRLGIVILNWPDSKSPQLSDFAYPIYLSDNMTTRMIPWSNESEKYLTDKALQDISRAVEDCRISNIAARRITMITEYIRAHSSNNKILIYDSGLNEIIEDDGLQRKTYIPIVGVPKSADFNYMRNKHDLSKDEACILYSGILVRNEWKDYLNWLNSNSRIRIEEFNGVK